MHVDQPALLFSVLAFLGVLGGRRSGLILSGVAAAAAAWCKQPSLVVVLPLVVYIGFTRRRLLVHWGLAVIFAHVVFFGVFSWWHGADVLLTNMISVPEAHPWRTVHVDFKGLSNTIAASPPKKILALFAGVSAGSMSFGLLFMSLLAALFHFKTERKSAVTSVLWGYAVLSTGIAAAFYIAGLIGQAKIGGDVNTQLPTVVFLFFAGVATGALAYREFPSLGSGVLVPLIALPPCVSLACLIGFTFKGTEPFRQNRIVTSVSSQQETVYLPFEPLVAREVYGWMHPVSDVLGSWERANMPDASSRFAESMPQSELILISPRMTHWEEIEAIIGPYENVPVEESGLSPPEVLVRPK